MKNILIYIAIFLLYNNCYAITDSLPGCINEKKISTESFITEYEYKGQRWFVFTKINPPPEPNVSDKMYYKDFYDAGCQLVCAWTKGGIMGLNRVKPDTIEKAKIKKIGIVQDDTTKKYNTILNALPDTIIKLALAKNVQEIVEYLYQDKILYNFHYPLYYKQELPKKGSVTFDDSYYDKNGRVILIYKRALVSTFTRAEHWVPTSVKRSDVTKVKNGIWLREKNSYRKL